MEEAAIIVVHGCGSVCFFIVCPCFFFSFFFFFSRATEALLFFRLFSCLLFFPAFFFRHLPFIFSPRQNPCFLIFHFVAGEEKEDIWVEIGSKFVVVVCLCTAVCWGFVFLAFLVSCGGRGCKDENHIVKKNDQRKTKKNVRVDCTAWAFFFFNCL